MREELTAVAYAQNGHAETVHTGIHMGRTGLIDAVRAAGENDADRGKGFYLFQRRAEGLDFAIDVALTDTAGDKLVILSAEVENKYLLIFHAEPP